MVNDREVVGEQDTCRLSVQSSQHAAAAAAATAPVVQ